MSGTHTKNEPPSKKLWIVLILTAGYMIFEAVGGILSNSLALLADAGHMLSDVAALSISLFAFVVASRPPDEKASFGYHRAEVLAAFFNGLVLLLVSFFIIKEAIERLFHPTEVEPTLMLVVAFGGLLVNITSLFILHQDNKNLNVRGAWLHVVSDALGSVGCVISGFLIYFFGWRSADAWASIIIAGLVCYSAVKLILETMRVLMEQTPAHIKPDEITKEILKIPQVLLIHDLHIWSITTGKEALSAHVVVEKDAVYDVVLQNIQKKIEDNFSISHATIQLENECQVKNKTCHYSA